MRDASKIVPQLLVAHLRSHALALPAVIKVPEGEDNFGTVLRPVTRAMLTRAEKVMNDPHPDPLSVAAYDGEGGACDSGGGVGGRGASVEAMAPVRFRSGRRQSAARWNSCRCVKCAPLKHVRGCGISAIIADAPTVTRIDW